MMSRSVRKRPEPFYNPSRDRRRIVWAMVSLTVVLYAIVEARKPKHWTWIAPEPRTAAEPSRAKP